MRLERIHVFPVATPIASLDRDLIERTVSQNVGKFGRQARFDWLRRGKLRFLRITVDPVIVEIVFHAEQIEVFASMPFFIRILFTDRMRRRLADGIRTELIRAGKPADGGDRE